MELEAIQIQHRSSTCKMGLCYTVRTRRHAKLQAAMEDVMTAIVRLVNDKKDHIPPVTSPAVLTFPFEITIAG